MFISIFKRMVEPILKPTELKSEDNTETLSIKSDKLSLYNPSNESVTCTWSEDIE